MDDHHDRLVTDVLGAPITPGCTIVYAANGGRAEQLRKAIVLRIEKRHARRAGLAPCLVVRSEYAARAVVLRDPRRTVVVAPPPTNAEGGTRGASTYTEEETRE